MLKLVTAPATEPVTLAEAKAHLRVTASDEDTLLTNLIVSARQDAEEFTRRAFITQTWDYALDAAGLGQCASYGEGYSEGIDVVSLKDAIEIPRPPLISVTSVKSYSTGNVEAVFASANYFVDTLSEPGRIALNLGQVWPTDLRAANALIVRFVAGYGAAGAVPQKIKDAMLRYIAYLYENREGSQAVQFAGQLGGNLPGDVQLLLSRYRVVML